MQRQASTAEFEAGVARAQLETKASHEAAAQLSTRVAGLTDKVERLEGALSAAQQVRIGPVVGV